MQFKVGGAPRPLVPSGSQIGRLYSIVDLGTHDDVYQGTKRSRPIVVFTWELPGQVHDFGRGVLEPMAISRKFTASMNSKAGLRKFIEGWRGSAFTDEQAGKFKMEQLMGATCVLNIIHGKKSDGEARADVAAAAKLMAGQTCPDPINKPIFYELKLGMDEKGPFSRLPKWQQEMVAKCRENQPKTGAEVQQDAPEEDQVPWD